LYHVATSAALGEEEHGGGLFADTSGAFIDCGKPAGECGRVPTHKQPLSAVDEELAAELWERTRNAIGHRNLQPLRDAEVVEASAIPSTQTGSAVPSTEANVAVDVDAFGTATPIEPDDADDADNAENAPEPSGKPMTIKFSREEHGTMHISFAGDAPMRDLFEQYSRQTGVSRKALHFTIWGQDVDLDKTVAATWDLLQLDKEDAVDVGSAD